MCVEASLSQIQSHLMISLRNTWVGTKLITKEHISFMAGFHLPDYKRKHSVIEQNNSIHKKSFKGNF